MCNYIYIQKCQNTSKFFQTHFCKIILKPAAAAAGKMSKTRSICFYFVFYAWIRAHTALYKTQILISLAVWD